MHPYTLRKHKPNLAGLDLGTVKIGPTQKSYSAHYSFSAWRKATATVESPPPKPPKEKKPRKPKPATLPKPSKEYIPTREQIEAAKQAMRPRHSSERLKPG
jgi:hypothetical protein